MGIVVSWLSANWFSLLQTAGIVGGLSFTAYSLLINSRVRKVEMLLNITAMHRGIWMKVIETPALKRIMDPHADLKKRPATEDELDFANLVILHMMAVREAYRTKVLPKPAGFDTDVRHLFLLPIPHAAWVHLKKYRDDETIQYVEGLLIRYQE